MADRRSRTVRAHDVDVRLRQPAFHALMCLLTAGIWGAVHHFRMTRDVARFGRARGAMPFPFIPVAPGSSTLAWLAGLGSWYLLVASSTAYAFELWDGASVEPDDVTGFVSLALLLAPLWLVATHTIRRIRTVQHLAGVDAPYPSPVRGALLTALFPPLYTWHAQRQLNRAWRVYRDAGGSPA